MTEKNQYKIAVLLPTRGRTDALARSIMGLFNRAVDPQNIHLMLGFDNDDQSGIVSVHLSTPNGIVILD